MSLEITIGYPKKWTSSKDLEKDVLEKIFYLSENIKECIFAREGLKVTFYEQPINQEEFISSAENLLEKLAKYFCLSKHDVLETNQGCGINQNDPYKSLLESGDIQMTLPGVPILRYGALKLFKGIDGYLLDYALKLGCREEIYPTTLPTLSLLKSGYLNGFPQHALFVGAIHHDFDSLCAIANEPEKYAKPREIDNLIGNHMQVLAPTVCGHCFESLKGTEIKGEPLLVTAVSKCHRHEGRNHHSLDRLQTYTMREIIFLGDDEFVRSYQERILDDVKTMLTRWGITWRITVASDPFFATGSEVKKVFQTMMRLKYELQTYIPHRDQWIAVASFNHHQDTLVNSYDIGGEKNMSSGCFGLGFERFIYTVYSQHGINVEDFPETILNELLV